MSKTCPLCAGTGVIDAPKGAQESTLFDEDLSSVAIEQEPPAHAAARTAEQLARLAITPKAGSLRLFVLERAIERGHHGITSIEATEAYIRATVPDVLSPEEMELAVRRKLYSIAPRLTELVDGLWLADSDDVRDRRMIYRPTPKAIAAAAAAS